MIVVHVGGSLYIFYVVSRGYTVYVILTSLKAVAVFLSAEECLRVELNSAVCSTEYCAVYYGP